jgi:hypothetical protein
MTTHFNRIRNYAYAQLFGQTSLSPVSVLRSANRTDWSKICSGAYRTELVTLYKCAGLAERGVSFVDAVSAGQLSAVGKEIGIFESFRVKVIVTDRNSLANAPGYRAWETKRRFKKVMIVVDPGDENWLPRLIRKVLGHYESNPAFHPNLDVDFYERGGEKRIGDSKLLRYLMANPSREIYSLVEMSTTVRTRPEIPMYVRKTLKMREAAVVKIAEEPTLSKAAARRARRRERMIKAPMQGQQKAVALKMPEKPLEGLSKDLSERISSEMFDQASATYKKTLNTSNHKNARAAVDALIADPMFVTRSVAKAVTDDSLYAKTSPSTPTAAAYWSKRGANIGDMINTISTSVSRGVSDMNAGAMFKSIDSKASASKTFADTGKSLPIGEDQNASIGKAFTGDIAKKAFSDATIGCGIWDCFKDWIGCGVNACGDNGGHDFGPANDVCLTGAPHYRCAPFYDHCDSLLPRVHCVPHRCHDDRNVIKQKVVLRIHGARRKAKHSHHHGVAVGVAPHVVAVPVAGEDSDSSGDEEVSYDRAMRRQHGLAYRNVHSDGEEDDDCDDEDEFCSDMTSIEKKVETTVITSGHGHIDQVKYSNFLSLVKESGHLSDSKPYVLLALDNNVLTASNMSKIRASKEGCRGFVSRYMVYCHKDAHDLHHPCFHHPTLLGGVLMVSAAGVHFAAHAAEAGAHLVLATGATLAHATLHAVHFLTCPLFPHHVRILPFHYLHHHFPKHGHGHVYVARPAVAQFDSPHIDI